MVRNDGEPEVAFQLQLGREATTPTEPVPPTVGKAAEPEVKVKKQLVAGFWVMGNATPPIMIDPVRGPPGLAATENMAVAFPTSNPED